MTSVEILYSDNYFLVMFYLSHLLIDVDINLQIDANSTSPQKDMIEQASQLVAQDNTELACVFIQKTAIEKAIPDIDKRLATVCIYSETWLNQTLSKPKTCLNQISYSV